MQVSRVPQSGSRPGSAVPRLDFVASSVRCVSSVVASCGVGLRSVASGKRSVASVEFVASSSSGLSPRAVLAARLLKSRRAALALKCARIPERLADTTQSACHGVKVGKAWLFVDV